MTVSKPCVRQSASYAWHMAAETLRRTKIVATLGPASTSKDVVAALVRAGMDAARLNFSHGTRE
jgi:Pyruvate kinase, barrel domain